MRYLLTLVSVLVFCCAPKSTDEIANDTTSTAIDTLTSSLPNDPLAVYQSGYKIIGAGAAEQARMNLTYLGNRQFEFSIDYQVADFCSAQESGTFTLLDDLTASDSTTLGRALQFSFAPDSIQVVDRANGLGVGECGFSNTYVSCHGLCEEISWEEFDMEGEEVEEVEADSTGGY